MRSGYGTFTLSPTLVNPPTKRRCLTIVSVLGVCAFLSLFQIRQRYHLPQDESAPLLQEASMYMNANRPQVMFGAMDTQSCAFGKFNDSLLHIGWGQLWITATATGDSYAEVQQAMYCAGYLEGTLTHHRIDQHYHNTFHSFFATDRDQQGEQKVKHFLEKNLKWLRKQIQAHTHPNRAATLLNVEYWHMIGTLLAQFEGLVAGYQRFSQAPQPLNEVELFLLNADGDLEDLIPALNRTRTREPGVMQFEQYLNHSKPLSYQELVKSLKCSALIRLLPDNSNVLWGHTTWDQFSAMNRIYKHYDFPIFQLDPQQPQRRKISMSSSPAYLASVDDWYILDHGLSILETTNGLYDDELYNLIIPQNILTWMRANAANMMATTGPEWATIFALYNSGTYNNQWMILDLNQFQPGVGFGAHGLTVVEQVPGMIEADDVTWILNEQHYWASYNVPFHDKIYKLSGFEQMYIRSNYSSSWSYEFSPRAMIFRRDVPQVATMDDMKALLRYNNWKEDPLSEGHPANAIASRYDLEIDATYSLDGGIDTKVTSLHQAQQLRCEAISGPTRINNPMFSWTSVTKGELPHRGHPQDFDFNFEPMGP